MNAPWKALRPAFSCSIDDFITPAYSVRQECVSITSTSEPSIPCPLLKPAGLEYLPRMTQSWVPLMICVEIQHHMFYKVCTDCRPHRSPSCPGTTLVLSFSHNSGTLTPPPSFPPHLSNLTSRLAAEVYTLPQDRQSIFLLIHSPSHLPLVS